MLFTSKGFLHLYFKILERKKMKITYNKNPLLTTVELDENEKKELWYKIKIKEMVEILFSAHFYLEEKYYNLQKAKNN